MTKLYIYSNTGGYGGVYLNGITDPTSFIKDSTFLSNISPTEVGGGLSIVSSNVTIDSCIFGKYLCVLVVRYSPNHE